MDVASGSQCVGRMKHIASLFAAAALLAAPVPAFAQAAGATEPPADASGERPGDDQLTCTQLDAEQTRMTAEMMTMSREIQAASAERMRSARQAQSAAQGAAIASGLASAIPLVGGIVGSVVGQAARARAMAAATGGQDRMMDLSERMMTRSAEISPRINRIEMLRDARRCPSAGRGVADAEPGEDADPVVEPSRE